MGGLSNWRRPLCKGLPINRSYFISDARRLPRPIGTVDTILAITSADCRIVSGVLIGPGRSSARQTSRYRTRWFTTEKDSETRRIRERSVDCALYEREES
jgi:hypothetical protein